MVAIDLVRVINTMCDGLRIVITNKGTQIKHEYKSYYNYDKKNGSVRGIKTRSILEIIFGLIGAIGIIWGIYQDVSSREKDDEIERLKTTIEQEEKYIKSMRDSIKRKEEIIEIYNRSSPPYPVTTK